MFLLFGFKRYVDVLGVATSVCGHCHHPAAQRVERWTTRFTLFFVPLFTTSTRYAVQCAYCGVQRGLGAAEAERLVADGQRAAG